MSPLFNTVATAAASAVVSVRDISQETQAPRVILAVSICPAIALIFVAGRVYTRAMVTRKFFLEDYVIVVAMMSSIGMSVFMGLSCYYGFGRHQFTVTPWEQMEQSKVGIGGIQLYLWTHFFLKLSILLQYLRISIMPLERRLCYTIIAVLVGETIALSVTHLCLCTPFEALWTPGLPGAKCLNRTAVYYAQLGITIGMDFVILIAPLFILRHLKLRFWRQRLVLSIVLAFGGFACIISVLRLQTILDSTTSKDGTWDKVPSAFYGAIEPNLGIVCACLVTLRPLVVRHIPIARKWLSDNQGLQRPANGAQVEAAARSGQQPRPTFWSRMIPDSLRFSTAHTRGMTGLSTTKMTSSSSEYTELGGVESRGRPSSELTRLPSKGPNEPSVERVVFKEDLHSNETQTRRKEAWE